MSQSAALPENKAGWEHFPHDADVGVQGWGTTAAQAFEQVAYALTAVITHAEVKPQLSVRVRCEAPDLELLLVEWLNAIIYEMAVRKMLFGRFAVRIDDGRLEGTLGGGAGRRRAPCPGLRAERGNLYGSAGRQGPRRHLVCLLHRGRLVEHGHGSYSFHSGRSHDVADRAIRRHAGTGRYLCRREPHPRHG